MTMTIYETSNCVQRCRYTYRWPCRTEYNPDYYSRDQIKCRIADYNDNYNANYNANYNVTYNTEYKAKFVMKAKQL